MFGSLNTDSMTGKAIFLLYCLILIVFIFLWIQLLRKKREAEKGTSILFAILTASDLASLIFALFQKPINTTTVIEKVVLLVVFAVITATEILCYLKKIKEEESSE